MEKSLGQRRGVGRVASWSRRQPRQVPTAPRRVLRGRMADTSRGGTSKPPSPRSSDEPITPPRTANHQAGARVVRWSTGRRRERFRMRALSWATNQLVSFQKGCAVGHRPWLHGTNVPRIIAHFCSRDAAATSRMPRLCFVVRSVPWSSSNWRGRKLCELNEPRQARTALRLLRGPTSTAPRHDMGAGLAQRFSDFVCTKSLNAMPPSG